MSRKMIFGAAVLGLLVCSATMAEERKVYKHVDEKGNVTYSQTPPMSGAKAKKVDVTPAYTGRGGNTRSVSPYDNPHSYSQDDRQQQHKDALQESQQRTEEARKKRLADLEAECVRNRGTDCKDPQALRYQESTQIPRGYRR